jgi:hypothetical protein
MDLQPFERRDDPEAVTPEIVGLEPRVPAWRRWMHRAAFSLALAVGGLVVCAVGTLFTLTVVGAVVGVPLIFAGLFALLLAAALMFGRGKVGVVRMGRR